MENKLTTGRLFHTPYELPVYVDNIKLEEDDLDRADLFPNYFSTPIKIFADPLVEYPNIYAVYMETDTIPRYLEIEEERPPLFAFHAIPCSELIKSLLLGATVTENFTTQISENVELLDEDSLKIVFVNWVRYYFNVIIEINNVTITVLSSSQDNEWEEMIRAEKEHQAKLDALREEEADDWMYAEE